MRELRAQEELLLSRDKAPILYVPAQTWSCVLCDPPDMCDCGHSKATHVRAQSGTTWCNAGCFEVDRDAAQHEFRQRRASVAVTTVVWQGRDTDGPHGRCSTCGQKFVLARMGEAVPDPLEQMQRPTPE